MSNTNENETPNADWANWALLDAVSKTENLKSGEGMGLLSILVDRFRETLSDRPGEAGPRCFLVMTDWCTWGAGTTLAEACAKAKKAGAPAMAKAVGHLVLNDSAPYVTKDGMPMVSSKATFLFLGPLGTLASVMRAGKGGAS